MQDLNDLLMPAPPTRPQALRIALNVVQFLREKTQLDLYICGGAARDIALGARDPKDFDVFVLGELSKDADPLDTVSDRLWSALQDLPGRTDYVHDKGEEADDGALYNEMKADRIEFVYATEVHGVPFDFIRYSEHPKTPQEQLNMFDCTLNQFYLHQQGDLIAGVQHEVGVGTHFSMTPVRPLAGRVVDWPGRKANLQSKYPLLTFYDEPLYI
jgi:hypothetical protein